MDNDYKWPLEIEQYERKIFDLKQLIEISKGLNSTLDYNTLIDSILLTCMGQMQLVNAGIFLRKGLGYNTFTLHRNYKGFDIDHSREYEIMADSPMIQFLELHNRCFTLDELRREVAEDYSLSVLRLLDPVLVVPLLGKAQLNGIIILGDRISGLPFNEAEKEYLLNIGSLAGIAIHNSTLYEMATTDMLTHLKIHHYFHASLHDEFLRHVKNNRPLSLIMADIDHFKSFNDTYGHSVGDEVLRAVAGVIRDSIRPMDVAARYGGEEFAVILPRTDIHEALIVAERIRSGIENLRVVCGERELSVTISLGLSHLDPEVDRAKDTLVDRADKALYLSKEGGRNRVTFL